MGVLKVEEWKSGSGRWYVADTHNFTGWRACADVLDVEQDIDIFIEYLRTKRGAVIDCYVESSDLLIFYWTLEHYKEAHQFKLDVNRIARKKNYLI